MYSIILFFVILFVLAGGDIVQPGLVLQIPIHRQFDALLDAVRVKEVLDGVVVRGAAMTTKPASQ